MTEKRFKIVDEQFISYYGGTGHKISNGECGFWLWHSKEESQKVCDKLNSILDENEQLKKELNKLKKFEYGGEHIRLSINIETGELQRHIYATGQWFGDFDRVLVDNWLSEEDYQRFINRVIEVYNTEFKKELQE